MNKTNQAVRPIDVALENIRQLSDFITGAIGVTQTLKIEMSEQHRLNMLERIATGLVHSVTPLANVALQLVNEISELEQRVVELENEAFLRQEAAEAELDVPTEPQPEDVGPITQSILNNAPAEFQKEGYPKQLGVGALD